MNNLFALFLDDLGYINTFIAVQFGTEQILLNKNKGKFLGRDYALKNSRIKGYVFHGYGCLFQFKDMHIDIDLRFDNVGFSIETLLSYLQQKGKAFDKNEVQELLERQVSIGTIKFWADGIYTMV